MTYTHNEDVVINGSLTLDHGTDVNEFSTDTTLDGDSNDAVPTEAAVKDYIDKACMIGSANAAWVPCAFEGTNPEGSMRSGEQMENVDGTNHYPRYMLCLPTNRGGKKLYVSGVRVLVQDADNDDYLSMTKVIGITYSGSPTAILNSSTDVKSAQRHEKTFTATDCSSYDMVAVTLYCSVTTAYELGIRGVTVKAYYA